MSETAGLDAFDVGPSGLWSELLNSLPKRIMRSTRLRQILEKWPRHLFVDQSNDALMRLAAGMDSPLSIGHGQTISQPQLVVRMTRLLRPKQGERVLDIGLGSGWQAAILQERVGVRGKVVAIERIAALLHATKKRFEELGLHNIELILGDATNIAHWPEGQFHVITCAAGCDREPDFWRERLAEGGRMVVPRKAGDVKDETYYQSDGVAFPAEGWEDGPMHQLVRTIRFADGYREEEHDYCGFVPLVSGAIQKE
ncbi:methyltransferase domain-containing protein [Candidatus Peregrinibacteria bacterium]|nr:methyltransferase domain-containing protein [Candidatus Peregrinibacteria bacterium]